ncbi:MAG: hypothetical protein ACPGXY_04270 [Alphaproteobacteria bacterium]
MKFLYFNILLSLFIVCNVYAAADEDSFCVGIEVDAKFYEAPAYDLDGSKMDDGRSLPEFKYNYHLIVNYNETLRDGDIKRERELKVEIPKQAAVEQTTCTRNLLSNPNIRDIKVKVVATPTEGETFTRELSGEKYISRKDHVAAGKIKILNVTKTKQEYTCSPKSMAGPFKNVRKLKVKVGNNRDDAIAYNGTDSIPNAGSYVGRELAPHHPIFDDQPENVVGIWAMTTRVPVECSHRLKLR